MTAEIIHAFGTLAPDEQKAKLLVILDEARAEIEAGSAIGIAVAIANRGGEAVTLYSARDWCSLAGVVSRLSYHIQKSVDAL